MTPRRHRTRRHEERFYHAAADQPTARRRVKAVILLLAVLAVLPKQARADDSRIEAVTFVSGADGAEVRYAFWRPPDYDDRKQWPLIVFLHGSAEGDNWQEPTKPEASIPVRTVNHDLPFVVVFPLMRGSRLISNVAELDVLETIDDMQDRLSIDPARIHLTGISFGGFAAWRLATRYPDRFASVTPFCAGGEPELAVNLHNLGVRIVHGTADRHVSFRESKRMNDALADVGIDAALVTRQGVGHVCWREPYADPEIYRWMSDHRRPEAPTRIRYRTHTLRHHQAYWVSIESMPDPAKPAFVDIFAPDPGRLYIHAENTGRLRLTPPQTIVPAGTTPSLTVNGRPATPEPSGRGWLISLVEDAGDSLTKRPGLSGPIQDVYYDSFAVVVPGRSGNPDPTWAAIAARCLEWYTGLVYQKPRILTPNELTSAILTEQNLIVFGQSALDAVLADKSDELPIRLENSTIIIDGEPGRSDLAALVMIHPNPLAPDRYLVICTGHPAATVKAAQRALIPPQLTRPPLEDLVVLTRDGQFPLATAASARNEPQQSMAAPPQTYGTLFDSHWNPTPATRSALLPRTAK